MLSVQDLNYMFIEQIQMANISFSTCVIIQQFKVFCFRDTQNFLGGAGGTTEASVDGFLGSSVQLPSKALSQAGLVHCLSMYWVSHHPFNHFYSF